MPKRDSVLRKAQLLNAPLLEVDGIGFALAIGIAGRIVDRHLIQTGRKRGDSIKVLENRAVFETRNAGRHENPEMPDMRIDEIHDPLAGAL